MVISFIGRKASWRNALIVLILFIINTLLLDVLDRPLLNLAGGEAKLDLQFGYNLATVERLFSAYGTEGRAIYGWNLLVDTPFPVLGAVATILFAFLAFEADKIRQLLLIAPLVFAVTDIIENIVLFVLVQSYPELSTSLVSAASIITQIKRTAFYLSAMELLIAVFAAVVRWIRDRNGAVEKG